MSNNNDPQNGAHAGIWSLMASALSPKTDVTPREALEEYIVGHEDGENDSASTQEKALLSNILKLRDIKVEDVMVPRADIVAVEVKTPQKDLLSLFAECRCSRIPVFNDNLDNIMGTVHVKDILAALAEDKNIKLKNLLTNIPVVSPSMDILDLILYMREKHRHMALVVDEYGGVDGLITVSDVIEAIVGDIDDEHDTEGDPQMIDQDDGSIFADARVDIEDFEDKYGSILSNEEREESDTLGGLVCDMAGRVPAKGEILTHETGTIFEILDADPRRVSSMKIYNLP